MKERSKAKERRKTKEQLINELIQLRHRTSVLEASGAERREAEKQSLSAIERLEHLLSSTSAVIYTSRPSDDYGATFVGGNVTEMVGYEPREFLEGDSFWMDHVHPKDVQRVVASRPQILECGRCAYEYRFMCRDGRYIWVRDEARLVRDKEGNPLEIVGYWVDVTERKQAEEMLKRVALETLEVASTVVEANDPYAVGHSKTVTNLALEVAEKMGLGEEQLHTLCVAGLLHDLGKVGIPGSVLSKPARLTQAERVMIEAHPAMNATIVARVEGFRDAVPVIRHHHERWDGTGYPDGLRGEDIPILARILAVADAFEAMTAERPYRKAQTEEKVLAELNRGAGTQWDPEVVRIFIQLRESRAKQEGSNST